ncbi:hypothetical protein FM038_009235 [Shewanella eurypsychrophilus]|uniref:Uncharacterized protein n=1 Tax=Shewanella eurypsychrophilus TaxID=2593656 RepID=A0ABX6V4S7_9GAMM|nr:MULTISPECIES: hypothetical protein [Shewanella]QFU22323.1 hypothetical protein FS418_10815 [Shewanella sp. YLB-09]QPG57609.1 hypothetical protein FM038_009235 [Shewanella eurypsychrophilus]
MTTFHITRIHTSRGIFRLSGNWTETLEISAIEFMGTDGWVALNLADVNSHQLIASLEQEVLTHLNSQHKGK